MGRLKNRKLQIESYVIFCRDDDHKRCFKHKLFQATVRNFVRYKTTGEDARDATNNFLLRKLGNPAKIQKCFFLDAKVDGIFPTFLKEIH